MEIIGTFHVSENINGVDEQSKFLHESVQNLHEDASLVLMFSPQVETNTALTHLPFNVYERVYRGQQSFAELPVRIETEEAERIAVDDIAASGPSGGGGPKLSAELRRLDHAAGHLQRRLRILLEFVNGVRDGRVPWDNATLSKIDMAVSQLQSLNVDQQPGLQAALDKQESGIVAEALAAAASRNSLYLDNIANLFTAVTARGVPPSGYDLSDRMTDF